jgi:hypothetical protein
MCHAKKCRDISVMSAVHNSLSLELVFCSDPNPTTRGC